MNLIGISIRNLGSRFTIDSIGLYNSKFYSKLALKFIDQIQNFLVDFKLCNFLFKSDTKSSRMIYSVN